MQEVSVNSTENLFVNLLIVRMTNTKTIANGIAMDKALTGINEFSMNAATRPMQ